MEFFFDIRFLDLDYDAIVHFVATFKSPTQQDADLFISEFEAALNRKNIQFYPSQCYRIDNDEVLKNNSISLVNYLNRTAQSSVLIEQFRINNPDQTKSLADNLMDKFFAGEKSIAEIGGRFNFPARALDSKTREPLGELYYFSVEHLIPKA